MKPLIFDGYRGDHVRSFWDMKRAGIQLAIFKASQGLGYIDRLFAPIQGMDAYPDRAASTGMRVGGYHFGGAGSGVIQAKNYLALLKPGWLMVLDIERYPKSQMTVAQAEDFVRTVLAQTGRTPVLYYGEWLLEMEDKCLIGPSSPLRKCPAWVSRYGDQEPRVIRGHDLNMWQYTGDGEGLEPHRISGCDNDADLSVWVGDPADIPLFVDKHSFPGVNHA
ncbi:MAG: hypothetical protein GC165_07515 [Armatimonadetes bacterium]|nr:hypothetical protein [Armatimonadota bacterium]